MQKVGKWQQLKIDVKRNKVSYIMLTPYFVLFFIFTVLPVVASVVIGFTDFNMLELPHFVGWKNYIRLFLEDDIFKKALKNTLIFAVVTGPLSYIMCFLFAWVINEFKGKVRAFLTLIFYAPSISGNAFMVWAIIISGDRYGYLKTYSVDADRKICITGTYSSTVMAQSWNRFLNIHSRTSDSRQKLI